MDRGGVRAGGKARPVPARLPAGADPHAYRAAYLDARRLADAGAVPYGSTEPEPVADSHARAVAYALAVPHIAALGRGRGRPASAGTASDSNPDPLEALRDALANASDDSLADA